MSQPSLFKGDDPDLNQLLNSLKTTGQDSPHAWPRMLADLVDIVHARLEHGVPDNPREACEHIIVAIATYLGGRQLYLPRSERLQRALRDRHIWRDFNGHNVEQLAQQHSLTSVQIYQILSEQRSIDLKRRQAVLPLHPPSQR